MSFTVGTINGLFSLCRNGLISWSGGFGPNVWNEEIEDNLAGNYEYSVGYLSYKEGENDTADDVIDELSTLLTSGRLGGASKQYIKNIYSQWSDNGKKDIARIFAQQLIATTPEFHGTNIVNQNSEVRAVSEKTPPADVPYKAVVYLHLFGGLDSFNVLVPHTDCLLYQDYAEERGAVGLTGTEMLSIDAVGSNQTCDKFGVNYKLPALRDIYNEEKGIFIANIGHLSKPVTRNNYKTETNTDLFSHNSMEEEAFAVDAFREKTGTGVLGRMLDIFEGKGLSVGPISIDSKLAMLAGDPRTGRSIDVIPNGGPEPIQHKDFETKNKDVQDMFLHMKNLNKVTELNSGFFGDYWSQNLIDVMNKSQELYDTLRAVETPWIGGSGVENQLKIIAKLIIAHAQRGVNRDAFVVKMGGFDHHSNLKNNMNHMLPQVNTAILKFKQALVSKGLFDNVVFVLGSEFGRTITPNTDAGTDHAWGGNVFMFGGGVDGKRIIGEYPKSFGPDDPTNIGRGRLVPTTSWDALWYGIGLWFGIDQGEDMKYVLPNSVNFACKLFSDQDLFVNGTKSIKGCGGKTFPFKVGMFIDSPRYLTGKEQKKLCELAVKKLPGEVSSTRCVIIDTKIIVFTEGNGSRRLTGDGKTYMAQGTGTIDVSPDSTITPEDVAGAVQTASDESAENFVGATGVTASVELLGEYANSSVTGSLILSDDPYAAEFVEGGLAYDGTTSIIKLEVIAGTSGTTNLTLWAFDPETAANETVCNEDNMSEAQNLSPLPGATFLQDGSNSDHLSYEIDLNLTGVEDSNIYFSTTETSGEIKFCARIDKYLSDFNGSISFAETLVTLSVNMTTGFDVVVGVSRENPLEQTTNVDYTVDACICSDTFDCVAAVLEQNSEFNLCLIPENGGIRVDDVTDVDMYQGGENKFSPVDDGVKKGFTDVVFSADNIKAMVKTRVTSDFFETVNPPNIKIAGSANLAFVGAPRRMLENGGAETGETSVPPASFELSVGLKPLFNVEDSFATDEKEKGDPVLDGKVQDGSTGSADNGVNVYVMVVSIGAVSCAALAVGIFYYRFRTARYDLVK